MEKLLKNALFVPIVALVVFVLLALYIWDDKKNPNKDFYGMLKPTATV